MSAERLAELIVSSGPVVALTGAGISVPSGIPDFRTPGKGVWENVDPMEVAHISVWRRDPARFWSFYGQRFAILDGHEILEAEKIVERHDRYLVVEKAGDPEAEIVEQTDPRRPID